MSKNEIKMTNNLHSFVIIVLHLSCTILCDSDNQYRINDGGFLFSISRTIVSGKNETVCVSLHETPLPARIVIDFKWREKHSSSTRNLEAEHSCFEVFVPRLEIKDPIFVNLRIQVHSNGAVQNAHNQNPLVMLPTKVVKTFIDTDRGVYKPGDKVKFRIIVLDQKLLPVSTKISEIKIVNPLDVTVAVWEEVVLDNGLVSLEYGMVQESMIGTWKIQISGKSKSFEVSKYTLPRFKINLVYPQMIYRNTKSINIHVCAQYSYGRNVEGLAFVKIFDSLGHMRPIHVLKEMKDGCGNFEFTSEDLVLAQVNEKLITRDQKMFVQITATVSERGTNRIELANARSQVKLQAYSMKFTSHPVFKPGLPYHGKLKFSDIHADLSKELVEICYNIAIKKSWNYVNDEQCSNFTVDGRNIIPFSILPMTSKVIHMNLNARSLNHSNIGDSFLAVRLFSPSNSYIDLQQTVAKKEENECRPSQQFKVIFTADALNDNENITFYYMIKSSSQIFKLRKIRHQVKKFFPDYLHTLRNIVGGRHSFSKLGTSFDNFTLKFKLDKRVITNYQLLVYYVTRTGETVADTKNVNVEPCLMKVKVKWSQKLMVPGATANLRIDTGAHSWCSVSAIDKSTKFLSTNHRTLSLAALIESFALNEKSEFHSERQNCVMPERKKVKVATLSYEPVIANETVKRTKRHVYSFSEDFDAYDIINNFGSLIITNLKLVTKTCYNGPLLKHTKQVQFLTDQYENQDEDQLVSIRSNFPETWIWELVPVRGSVQLKRHLPHSISSWTTNVLCISDVEGIGFSEETEITSFQSFFVDILAPHTVKREEVFYLYAHVSNYWNHKFPIRITLQMSTGLELRDEDEKLSVSFCLSENYTISHKFPLKATELGTVNVSVTAKTDHQFPYDCGPETILSKKDSVLKKILVEPEGYPMKETKSALLCSEDSSPPTNVSWYITVPANIISETFKSHISLNGDLLGKTIENLEDLLDVPMGCGEQIMASVAPNLYVLRYLNATNKLKKSVRQRILRNLKIGYQRILNYVHKDGSFSAFGYHDPMGSMFLTTFVVKILQEAKEYIYVNQRIIDKAVAWIFENQLENGCFNTMLHVFQDMGGTSRENSTAGLTAYVILSLLEANIEVPKLVQTDAKYCIRSQHNPDKYSLALSCYAMFKLRWYHEADKTLKKLLAVSDQHQNMMWWSHKGNSTSASDIETTSYALLSLLHQNTSENMANALAVVRWLSSKFESKGSFKSTQDTVVALDALTRYLGMVKSEYLNLNLDVETTYGKQNLMISDSDVLKSRRINLKQNSGQVTIKIRGNGCVLAQVGDTILLPQKHT
ncbi:alpha-1-inhibitor 3 isoform X2 [Leptinotarsa decemlineata]|uniref:alpha-1-inhibitor 3 isoform X2 n=1 Tax=Leptinotarsa decemlineata TaxID=7539 RepID=UPI003D30911B